MTPDETVQGRMNLWDKTFTAAMTTLGKRVEEAIKDADKAVDAFEARFHPDLVKFRQDVGALIQPGHDCEQ
jgi:hypothetical protein